MVDRLLLKVLQLAGVDPSHNEAHPKVPLFAGYLILSAASAALGGRGGTEAALAPWCPSDAPWRLEALASYFGSAGHARPPPGAVCQVITLI